MFDVSRRFLANLGLSRWQPLVEWSPDGETWEGVELVEGSATADAGSQVCWGLDATLRGVEVGRFGLSPYGSMLRASMGLVYGPTDVEWVPLGLYRCDKAVRSRRDPDVVKVTGSSFEAAVIESRFDAPRVIPDGPARATVEDLIREVLPEALISWQVDEEWIPRIVTELDRWAVIDGDRDASSVARALAARMRTDGRGVFAMRPGSTLQDDPVWYAQAGVSLVDASETIQRDKTYNVVVVTGNADDGTPPVGPGIAEDLEPTSPTFVGRSPLQGGFGRVPRHYSSPLLQTSTACVKAARTQLADYLGLAKQADFDALPNYALEVGDVVLVDGPSGRESNVLDKITYGLTSASVKASTRATSTRFAGELSAIPNSEEAA